MGYDVGLKIYVKITFRNLIKELLKNQDPECFLEDLNEEHDVIDFCYSKSLDMYAHIKYLASNNNGPKDYDPIKLISEIVMWWHDKERATDIFKFSKDFINGVFLQNYDIPDELRFDIFQCTTYMGSQQPLDISDFRISHAKMEAIKQTKILKEHTTFWCQGMKE